MNYHCQPWSFQFIDSLKLYKWKLDNKKITNWFSLVQQGTHQAVPIKGRINLHSICWRLGPYNDITPNINFLIKHGQSLCRKTSRSHWYQLGPACISGTPSHKNSDSLHNFKSQLQTHLVMQTQILFSRFFFSKSVCHYSFGIFVLCLSFFYCLYSDLEWPERRL